MYLNTHTHTRKSSWPNPVLHPAKTNKQTNKIDLVASSLPWCFGRFPVSSSSPQTPGLPHPWGRRDSGLWFWKLADEVFVCLLLREGRGEEEAQGKGVQSLAGCVRRLVSIHSVGPGRAWGDRVFPEQVTHPDLSLCSSPGCDRLLPGRSQPLRISVGP